MIHWNDRRTSRIFFGLASTIVAVLVLSACVGVREDEPEPTDPASSLDVPTEAARDSTGTSLSSPSPPSSTPVMTEGTAVGTPQSGGGSPTPEIVVAAPPIAVPTSTPVAAAPASGLEGEAPVDSAISSDVTIGDGTGGTGAISSESSGEADEPDGGTPVASDVSDVATVTSCDIASYPPYSGDAPQQVTTVEVNFRAGPGSDCALIADPIAPGITVQVLSDPVQREGDDVFQWVAVSIDGAGGWLATEFLEPAGAAG